MFVFTFLLLVIFLASSRATQVDVTIEQSTSEFARFCSYYIHIKSDSGYSGSCFITGEGCTDDFTLGRVVNCDDKRFSIQRTDDNGAIYIQFNKENARVNAPSSTVGRFRTCDTYSYFGVGLSAPGAQVSSDST